MTVLQNRVISICNRKTSMRLAKSEWYVLDRICIRENLKRKQLLELIDKKKDPNLGLTPSVRLFSILYLHDLAKKRTKLLLCAGFFIYHRRPQRNDTLNPFILEKDRFSSLSNGFSLILCFKPISRRIAPIIRTLCRPYKIYVFRHNLQNPFVVHSMICRDLKNSVFL